MSDATEYTTILADVKSNLGITGTYQDSTIQGYIDEVKQFLLDGGVNESVVNSKIAKGLISRGVADLWNYGSGGTNLSPYFIQRASQLAIKDKDETPEAIAELGERIDDLENKFENALVTEDAIQTSNISNGIRDRVDNLENEFENVLVIEGDTNE